MCRTSRVSGSVSAWSWARRSERSQAKALAVPQQRAELAFWGGTSNAKGPSGLRPGEPGSGNLPLPRAVGIQAPGGAMFSRRKLDPGRPHVRRLHGGLQTREKRGQVPSSCPQKGPALPHKLTVKSRIPGYHSLRCLNQERRTGRQNVVLDLEVNQVGVAIRDNPDSGSVCSRGPDRVR